MGRDIDHDEVFYVEEGESDGRGDRVDEERFGEGRICEAGGEHLEAPFFSSVWIWCENHPILGRGGVGEGLV